MCLVALTMWPQPLLPHNYHLLGRITARGDRCQVAEFGRGYHPLLRLTGW